MKKMIDLDRMEKEYLKYSQNKRAQQAIADQMRHDQWFMGTHKIREKMIAKMEVKEKPEESREITVRIQAANKSGKNVYILKDCAVKYPGSEEYILKNINLDIHKGDKIGIFGANGQGKSTLINAVVGDEVAYTSWGKAGTEELRVYEHESLPFRLIDSMGFEASSKRQHKAVNAVKRWSRDCAKEGREDTQVNVIWFCVDGTAARLFEETISQLNEATSMWKSVPVIAVITKSYSDYEQEHNIRMVREAFV